MLIPQLIEHRVEQELEQPIPDEGVTKFEDCPNCDSEEIKSLEEIKDISSPSINLIVIMSPVSFSFSYWINISQVT